MERKDSSRNRMLKTPVQTSALSIGELCTAFGLSRGFLNSEIRRGRLRALRFGRRVLVLHADLERYLSSLEQVGINSRQTPERNV